MLCIVCVMKCKNAYFPYVLSSVENGDKWIYPWSQFPVYPSSQNKMCCFSTVQTLAKTFTVPLLFQQSTKSILKRAVNKKKDRQRKNLVGVESTDTSSNCMKNEVQKSQTQALSCYVDDIIWSQSHSIEFLPICQSIQSENGSTIILCFLISLRERSLWPTLQPSHWGELEMFGPHFWERLMSFMIYISVCKVCGH